MTMIKTLEKLEQEYVDLRVKKKKLDMFFDVYLEKYDRFMKPDDGDNKYWKLYRAKLKEYDEIESAITTNRYFSRKYS